MTALIEADQLVKTFGPIRAVDRISLRVARGEVLGFLGPNGAGKSTTMKMITGFLEPDSGSARVAGFDVHTQPIAAKSRLGYLPEGAPAYAEMTPLDFLNFIASLRGLEGGEARQRVHSAIERTSLHGVLHQSIETLSKGFKRRVGLAQAILHNPAVLIMDEPTDGLDPNQKHHVRELIRDMARDKAIIVSTHILEEVEAVCSRAVVINKGRIVADGTAEELMRQAANHGAVSVRLSTTGLDALKRALEPFAGVSTLETTTTTEGQAHVRILPKASASIAPDITKALQSQSLEIAEIYVERGRLEDVFRQITTTDTGGRHA